MKNDWSVIQQTILCSKLQWTYVKLVIPLSASEDFEEQFI